MEFIDLMNSWGSRLTVFAMYVFVYQQYHSMQFIFHILPIIYYNIPCFSKIRIPKIRSFFFFTWSSCCFFIIGYVMFTVCFAYHRLLCFFESKWRACGIECSFPDWNTFKICKNIHDENWENRIDLLCSACTKKLVWKWFPSGICNIIIGFFLLCRPWCLYNRILVFSYCYQNRWPFGKTNLIGCVKLQLYKRFAGC